MMTLSASEKRLFEDIQDELRRRWGDVEPCLEEIARLAKLVRSKRLYRFDFETYDEWAQEMFGKTGKALDAIVWRETQKQKVLKASTENCEYVGTKVESEEPRMPARKIADVEVEYTTPPPPPAAAPCSSFPKTVVTVSAWNELHAILRYVNQLQNTNEPAFTSEKFRKLVGMLKTFESHIQMNLPGILDEVPAVKPRSRATIQELRAYCVERGLPADDGDWFHDKMLQFDWKVDGRKVADCFATIRNWQKLGYMCSQQVAGKTTRNGAPAEKHWSTKATDAMLARLKKEEGL